MNYKKLSLIAITCLSLLKPLDVYSSKNKYFVQRVIDGDTFVIENKERVRLIGIDTPEKGEPCYFEAKKKLEDLILDEKVVLKKDISERDRYHRLLRYTYKNKLFVNLEMIESGYAHASPYTPDIKYKEIFKKAEHEAKKQKIGCLWKKP